MNKVCTIKTNKGTTQECLTISHHQQASAIAITCRMYIPLNLVNTFLHFIF